jgi:hypothetical protein
MLKLSLNMLKLFKQTAGETLGTAGFSQFPYFQQA